MDRDTADLISNEFTFARMKAGPDLQAESADGPTDRSRTSDRPGCAWLPVESGEHSVAGSGYFSSPERTKLSAERCVIVTKHLVPATVTQQRGFLGRADDIDKKDRGKNTTAIDGTLRRTGPDAHPLQQLFISMAEPPCNCSFHVV